MNVRCHPWAALFCLALSAFPRQAGTPAGAAPRATNRQITLDVVVTDKSGTPVSGLEQQDFTVLNNKQPQNILSFRAVGGTTRAADPAIEIILLMDSVNTSFQSVANERDQIKRFLRKDGGQLSWPVSMVFFSDSGTQMQNATRDGNALIAALDHSDAGLRSIRRSEGVYGAADRLQLSLRALNSLATLEENKPGRKMLIWISPGWPLLSGPQMELTNKQHQQVFNEIVAVSTALWRARMTLYSIDPLGTADAAGVRTTYYENFLKGVRGEKQAQPGNLALQVLASQSGGRVLNSSNDIASEIASCVVDAHAFYVLSFNPPPADGPNEYHGLEVKIDKPRLKARTRTVYYAQP
ncbi:MAG: VWA domain-containing protein [Bryobacteraceae bacterium]